MRITDLNHVAIHVEDVDSSVRFYRDKIGLEEIPRPGFSFPGAWFRLGSVQDLHLIGQRDQPVFSGPRSTHFALQVESLDDACAELASRGVEVFRRQMRPDGALQAYVLDPDGHCVEFTQLLPSNG